MRMPAISPTDALARLRRSKEPIVPDTFAKAERALAIFQTAQKSAPFVFPTSDGGIQFEWHGAERELDIEVLPNSDCFAYATFEGGQFVRQGEDATVDHLLALLNWIR